MQLIPVAVCASYVSYVAYDRFADHDAVREEKVQKRRMRQAEEIEEARADALRRAEILRNKVARSQKNRVKVFSS